MNIVTEQAYTVFRNDCNGYSYYKIGISQKSQNGEWISGYIRCKFRNGISIENKTKIYIRKAWLSFYLKEKETIPYIFISEFETIDETIEKAKNNVKVEQTVNNMVKQESDPFKDFDEEITLSDDDLPF